MATTYDFPSDLLAGQEELHQVRAELSALLKRLPWSVEPVDGFSDDNGWRKVERPASPAGAPTNRPRWRSSAAWEHELAVFVSTHRYWAELTGPERVTARSRLKHAHEAPPEETDGAS